MSRLDAEQRDEIFRIYVTDCISGFVGVKVRYADLVSSNPKPEKSADEIIAGIKNKLGGSQEDESI